MRFWIIAALLAGTALAVPAEDAVPVQSIALDGPARERHYLMLYALGAAGVAAGIGGIAVRRRMLRALDAAPPGSA